MIIECPKARYHTGGGDVLSQTREDINYIKPYQDVQHSNEYFDISASITTVDDERYIYKHVI